MSIIVKELVIINKRCRYGKEKAETKSSATLGFEQQIWDAACVLWGHIPAADYRKVIVGLIFLRYISHAFDKQYQLLVKEGEGFEEKTGRLTTELYGLFEELHRLEVLLGKIWRLF